MEDQVAGLIELTDRHGYDDVFVYVPIKSVAEVADKVMTFDGCMNFFAGLIDNQFSAEINLYNTHYTSTHILGTTGGNTDDLIEAIDDFGELGKTDPLFAKLDECCKRHKGLWNTEAEKILFEHFGVKPLSEM